MLGMASAWSGWGGAYLVKVKLIPGFSGTNTSLQWETLLFIVPGVGLAAVSLKWLASRSPPTRGTPRRRLVTSLGVIAAAAVLAVTPAIVSSQITQWRTRDNRAYIERISGLTIPSGTKTLFSYSHWGAVVAGQHYQLPPSADNWTTTLFRPILMSERDAELSLFGADTYRFSSFPSGSQPPTARDSFLHAGGCTKINAWYALVNPASGELWIEVLYPDMGGDPPGCRVPDGALN